MTTAYPHNPTPQQTDPTMRALMEVHRAQVNHLERELGSERQAHQTSTASSEFREKTLRGEKTRAEEMCERLNATITERDKQIADMEQAAERLRDKVQLLQIELQTEREAHTGMRDAAHTTPEDEQ